MARYIDADALEEYIQETICAKCGDISDGIKCKSCGIDDTLDFLENAPTEDVVPRSEVEELSGKYEDLKLKYAELQKDKDELIAWVDDIKTEVVKEIYEEIDVTWSESYGACDFFEQIAELKKKYTEK